MLGAPAESWCIGESNMKDNDKESIIRNNGP